MTYFGVWRVHHVMLREHRIISNSSAGFVLQSLLCWSVNRNHCRTAVLELKGLNVFMSKILDDVRNNETFVFCLTLD